HARRCGTTRVPHVKRRAPSRRSRRSLSKPFHSKTRLAEEAPAGAAARRTPCTLRLRERGLDGRAQLKRIKPQRRRAARFGASERAAHRTQETVSKRCRKR